MPVFCRKYFLEEGGNKDKIKVGFVNETKDYTRD
jgi:hypothetical protein